MWERDVSPLGANRAPREMQLLFCLPLHPAVLGFAIKTILKKQFKNQTYLYPEGKSLFCSDLPGRARAVLWCLIFGWHTATFQVSGSTGRMYVEVSVHNRDEKPHLPAAVYFLSTSWQRPPGFPAMFHVSHIHHTAPQPALLHTDHPASLARTPGAFSMCLLLASSLLYLSWHTADAECRSGRKCLLSPMLWL